MKFKTAFVVIFLFVSVPFFALAQRDTVSLNTIITKTSKLAADYPAEKIYIHFDKPYYAAGDTIWFKAYLTIGLHQPSDLSKIIDIDIVNSQDSLIQSLKIPMYNGIGYGSVALNANNYKQGNYHLSAYTNWMRNFDPAYFFNKTIPIGDPVDNEVITSVSFPGNIKTNQGKILAHIVYKDKFGNPLTNKKISWSIETGEDKPPKGKTTTDQQGVANISVAANKAADLSGNVLVTVMDMGNRKTTVRAFSASHGGSPARCAVFPRRWEFICRVTHQGSLQGNWQQWVGRRC